MIIRCCKQSHLCYNFIYKKLQCNEQINSTSCKVYIIKQKHYCLKNFVYEFRKWLFLFLFIFVYFLRGQSISTTSSSLSSSSHVYSISPLIKYLSQQLQQNYFGDKKCRIENVFFARVSTNKKQFSYYALTYITTIALCTLPYLVVLF